VGRILKVFILLCGICFVGTIIRLLIKRKINERNSILWLAGAAVILILSAQPELLEVAAGFLGVDYPPSLLFLFSTLVPLLIALNQSIQISELAEQVKELTQHVAVKNCADNRELNEDMKHKHVDDGRKEQVI
jgi:hypothetical protein